DLATMEAGKYPIKDKDLFVNITTAKGKAPDEAVLETHIKMIDIQIPLDGPETYGYTPLCSLPEVEYNAEKDITKYPDLMAESFIDCQPGMFAIFFPQDGHAPCISMAPEIKKAIFKVKA
ncbi:MAG: YhcH/YjgK/YiaL family protein, partial [Prevotella sp.]|nr:YhcH/YjgK/YiaL family protein [Prevotella sp.]